MEWTRNLLAHLLSGIPWGYRGHWESGSLELCSWFSARPILQLIAVLSAVAFLATGVWRLAAKNRTCALLPIILLLPAILCFAETRIRGLFINEWYLIFVLPGVIALAALGIDQLATAIGSMAGRIAGTAFAALVISGYAAWSAPQRHFLMTRSIQPNLESVLLTRPSLDPQDPQQESTLTATFYGPPEPYDPNMIVVRSAVELGTLVRQADADGKPLFINLGYLTTVEGEHQNKYALLRASGFSRTSGYFPVSNPQCKAGTFSAINQEAPRTLISALSHRTEAAPERDTPTDRRQIRSDRISANLRES